MSAPEHDTVEVVARAIYDCLEAEGYVSEYRFHKGSTTLDGVFDLTQAAQAALTAIESLGYVRGKEFIASAMKGRPALDEPDDNNWRGLAEISFPTSKDACDFMAEYRAMLSPAHSLTQGGGMMDQHAGMHVLVCGGRDFNNVALLWRELDLLLSQAVEPGIGLVIDGASDDVTGSYIGADYWANQWASARGIPAVRVHAKWESFGKAAGPLRNSEMLRKFEPDIVVAFPGGRGTADMVRKAKALNVPVREIHPMTISTPK